MVCLGYVEHIAYVLPSFCKVPCFPYKAPRSCTQLRAKTIYIVNGDIAVLHVTKNLFFMRPNYYLSLFVFDNTTIPNTIFMKVFWYGIDALVIAISAETYLMLVVWLCGSLCDESVELITGRLYPLTDGKCNEKTRFSLYVEVGIRIASFVIREILDLFFHVFLFFLTKLQNSSISCTPSFRSLMSMSLTFSQC